MLEWAKKYIALDLPIIPLCPPSHNNMTTNHIERCNCPGKVPIIKDWQNRTETKIQDFMDWRRQWKEFNIGLPLGEASGYVGIDIDGVEGEQILAQLSGGVLPDTWAFKTNSGRRLLYTIPIGMKTKKFKQTGDGEHEECAFLCTGQQTVLPPSMHKNGTQYTWYENCSPEELDCAPAPNWLIALIQEDAPNVKELVQSVEPVQSRVVLMDLDNEFEMRLPLQDTLLLDKMNIGNQSTRVILEGLEKSQRKNKNVSTPKSSRKRQPTMTEEEFNAMILEGNRDNQMTKIIGHMCAKYRMLGKENLEMLALNHNKTHCIPPLEDDIIKAKVEAFWSNEEEKTAEYKKMKEESNSREEFQPLAIAERIITWWHEQNILVQIQSGTDRVWVCSKDEGPWQNMYIKDSAFTAMFIDFLIDPIQGGDPTWSTRNKIDDISNALKIVLERDGYVYTFNNSDIDTQKFDDYQYIPLTGGMLLEWKTGEIFPWDPSTGYNYIIPVEYDPKAKCPAWEKRLEEWLPDEGCRLIVQEFIGYSLIPYMGFEKAMWFLGGGANGKSLFLETINSVLGYQVVSSGNMRYIFSKFGTACLEGKILNICNEAATDYLKGGVADEFKNMVSGGRVVADVKNKAPKIFNNTAKFIFSSNNELKTADKSAGWLRRLIIIPFNQDFTQSKVPKFEIMEELAKEKAGIFNWAIEGLRRLYMRREFSTSKQVQDEVQQHQIQNNIAADFYYNCLKPVDVSVLNATQTPGTPASNINELFGLWILYRESTIQKRKQYLTNFLESLGYEKKRTFQILYNKNIKTATMCWLQLAVEIKDSEFLEYMMEEGGAVEREYAILQLKKLDTA